MDWLWQFGTVGAVIFVLLGLWLSVRVMRGDVITVHERDRKATYLMRLLGDEPADLLGAHSLEAVHPEDRSRVGRIWADLVDQPGTVMTFRYRLRDGTGAWRWVEDTSANLQHESDVGSLVINRRDITAEIEAQQQLERRVADRTRELEALYQADEALHRSLRLEHVLQALVDISSDTLGVEKTAILAWDEREERRVVRADRGFEPHALTELTPVLDAEIGQVVIRAREPIAVLEYPDPCVSSLLLRLLQSSGVQAMLCLPILAGDEVFANFYVFAADGADLSDEKQRLLVALAGRASLAVENARLFEAARGKAALEERQRLARELHDSVSQALYGIALNAGAARIARELDASQLDHLLNEVSELAEAGLAEMRALIFELRPESLQQEGLVAALEKQAAAARARHGLDIRCTLEREPEVPLPVKEALYRIVQESLQNTAKHARARLAEISLGTDDGALVLSVADDGDGFDPDGGFPGHLGLRSMQERAEAIGGSLTIKSAPGNGGTRIRVRVPMVGTDRGAE